MARAMSANNKVTSPAAPVVKPVEKPVPGTGSLGNAATHVQTKKFEKAQEDKAMAVPVKAQPVVVVKVSDPPDEEPSRVDVMAERRKRRDDKSSDNREKDSDTTAKVAAKHDSNEITGGHGDSSGSWLSQLSLSKKMDRDAQDGWVGSTGLLNAQLSVLADAEADLAVVVDDEYLPIAAAIEPQQRVERAQTAVDRLQDQDIGPEPTLESRVPVAVSGDEAAVPVVASVPFLATEYGQQVIPATVVNVSTFGLVNKVGDVAGAVLPTWAKIPVQFGVGWGAARLTYPEVKQLSDSAVSALGHDIVVPAVDTFSSDNFIGDALPGAGATAAGMATGALLKGVAVQAGKALFGAAVGGPAGGLATLLGSSALASKAFVAVDQFQAEVSDSIVRSLIEEWDKSSDDPGYVPTPEEVDKMMELYQHRSGESDPVDVTPDPHPELVEEWLLSKKGPGDSSQDNDTGQPASPVLTSHQSNQPDESEDSAVQTEESSVVVDTSSESSAATVAMILEMAAAAADEADPDLLVDTSSDSSDSSHSSSPSDAGHECDVSGTAAFATLGMYAENPELLIADEVMVAMPLLEQMGVALTDTNGQFNADPVEVALESRMADLDLAVWCDDHAVDLTYV